MQSLIKQRKYSEIYDGNLVYCIGLEIKTKDVLDVKFPIVICELTSWRFEGIYNIWKNEIDNKFYIVYVIILYILHKILLSNAYIVYILHDIARR